LSAAAARPHTLMGRTQPEKALGSITSGWFPQLARRNALHASKSNFGVPTKSALSNGIVCAVASGSALHPQPIPPRKKEGSFNVLMGADSTCRRSSARWMRTYLRGGASLSISCKYSCTFERSCYFVFNLAGNRPSARRDSAAR